MWVLSVFSFPDITSNFFLSFMYGVYPQRMNMMVQNMLGMNNQYRYLRFDLLCCDGLRNKCFSKTGNAAVTAITTNTRVHSGL